ncbi:Sec23-binding domain of Sec16-domain-containing protein [Cyathus striatus]|nr:Sec23-binding domain of Sec16-domain-containing protein [Cyathus striatus]
MNVIEPAASLFTGQDVDSDPFATLGEASDEPASNQQHPESVNTFPGSGTADFSVTLDNLPESSIHYPYTAPPDSVSATFGEKTHSINGWNPSTEHAQYDQLFASAYDASAGSQIGSAQNSINSQGTYPNQAGYLYSPTYNQSSQPQSEYPQASTHLQPYVQQIGTYTQPYDPYAPTQAEEVYTTDLQSVTKPYDSYTSQQVSTTSRYVPPYSVATAEPTIVAPPPSQDTSPPSQGSASLSRPKVYNAYDPPFPSMPNSRRGGTSRVSSSVPGFSSYQSQPRSTPPDPPLSQPPLDQYTASYTPEYSHPNTFSHLQPSSTSQGIDNQVDQHTISYSGLPQSSPPDEHGTYLQPYASLSQAPSHPTYLANAEHAHSAIEVPTDVEGSSIVPTDTTISNPVQEPQSSIASYTSGVTSPPMLPPKNVSTNPTLSLSQRPYSRSSLNTTHHRQPSMDRLGANTPPPPPVNGINSPPDMSKKGPLNTQLPPSRTSSPQALFDPYAPRGNKVANVYGVERAASPGSLSIKSVSGRQSTKPYRAGSPKVLMDSPPAHLMSNNSTYSPPVKDVSAPGKGLLQELARGHPSSYELSNYDTSVVQEITMKPLAATYAPSPSLIGANDPLGRTSARVPVVSFGCGGKLVTCFHTAGSLNTGFDVALSARNSTAITIRVLKDVIPDSALDVSTSYPGPLVSDPGSATAGIVRPGTATQTKNKKASVVKYLDERCDEISRGLGYLSAGSEEKRAASGKLILIKLLKIMIENDGRLTGSSQVDTAVRAALVPRLESELPESNNNTVPAYALADNRDGAHVNEAAISVCAVRPSALTKIQDFLLHGERQKAYHYALDEKLWAHAMIIASSIDKDAWKEVVNEFLKNELGIREELNTTLHPTASENSITSGRYESLRFAYSLFSGQGAAAVQELIPQGINDRSNGALLQPIVSIPQVTPRTPNFSSASLVPIPPESLTTWPQTVAMIISSPLSLESSAALTALGDQLLANQWIEAAHACYLLSPQTSAWGGVGNPAARIILIGSRNPSTSPGFGKDEDPLILSEIAEFGMSLVPVPKGQENFTGLPHLQAYRFIRATSLAELGHVQLAGRYCEAITASVSRGSPYFTMALLEQLKGLLDRINGVSHADKSGSWMGGKISKPSLDTIGGWFENRFTKLVTGDTETPTEIQPDGQKLEDRSFAGPFSHYSTISSTPSARSSPQPTTVNLHVLPPYRTNSTMSTSAYIAPQLDKAPYVVDYTVHRSSPGPYLPSGVIHNAYQPPAPVRGATQSIDEIGQEPATPEISKEDKDLNDTVQEVGWWGSTSYGDTSDTRTPTTATFMQVDPDALGSSSDGFISLMDTPLSVARAAKNGSAVPNAYGDNEEDDLGLSNSKPKPITEHQASVSGSEEVQRNQTIEKPPIPPERPELKPTPAASGSWLSRWWKRDTSTPGPVKASLGEESTFYYDKDLKRWVNKKAGAETSKPTLPPPPPRAQTASPGMTGPRAVAPPATNAARSASAIDLTTSPPSKPTMRVRSNLIPPPESAPSTPTGTRLTVQGPSPGRPKSQASARRNARSRYVDVFAQENGSA